MKLKKIFADDGCMVSALFTITFFWFGPIELFSANSTEMTFAFKEFWYITLLEGIVVFVVVLSILTFFHNSISEYVKRIIFIVSVCAYAQAMFLNDKMVTFWDSNITWDFKTKATNLCIWIALIVLLLCLQSQLKRARFFVAFFLSAIQLIALISILTTTGIVREDKSGHLTADNMLELGKDSNAIVFILDYFDTTTLLKGLEENPDYFEGFDGFEWYPDSLGMHSRTYPSIPYLLTGDTCYFDMDAKEYIKKAYDNGNIISDLSKNNINVAYFGYDFYLSDSVKSEISNYKAESNGVDSYRLCRYFLKMVLYRDLPYFCKRRFEYDINEINTYVRKHNQDGRSVEGDLYEVCNDEWFNNQLNEVGLAISNEYSRAFRFIHLSACHRDLGNKLYYGTRGMEIVKEYIKQIKELGIYNSATIIITADHGDSGSGDLSIPLPQGTVSPILLVKQRNAHWQGVIVNKLPVSQENFYPTVLDSFGLDYKKVGEPYYSLSNAEKERFFYYTALESDIEGEVELREFKLHGSALKKESYVETGRRWPIYFSMNRVRQ